MNPKQRIAILGSTGSVGANTLDVIARHPDRFEVFALTAKAKWELLLQQCAAFKPMFAVMLDPDAAAQLASRLKAEGLPTQVLVGAQAITDMACEERVDTVMAAIVGAAGLAPCMAAAVTGKRILLANKEALVVGGDVFMNAVKAGGATLLPIDSEHSAIFQSLPDDRAVWGERIDKIILTASGGPFLNRDMATFSSITPDEACAHPNWVMGRKISVDSATMMNKALEVIEAKYLFGVRPEQIEVVIHPQSIIHSMVQYKDASVVAQLGTPDMRVPISYGLSYPDRIAGGAATLDFKGLASMSFQEVDPARFPGLQLAWSAMAVPSGTILLNAANEVGVEAFLAGRIRFDQIHTLNAEIVVSLDCPVVHSLDEIMVLDGLARQVAHLSCDRLASEK
ncbi:MAG: 1-deoxy-D-xylulose-5-phosphate reductoisomerase [Cytophagales bacterium]|nr:1-deoxy-D-xylulose-5-phosphate reductoisomerase [Cytophagales bacterium]